MHRLPGRAEARVDEVGDFGVETTGVPTTTHEETEMFKRAALAACALVAAVVAAYLALRVATPPAEAAPTAPNVVIMRCLAIESPSFTYQVANLSHTPGINLTAVKASTIEGQGDNCAVAISKVLALGMDVTKMTLHATESALVVTFIK
jgi:hypothetical protein